MDSLIDILTIFTRSDLKSEILKEIERHTSNLTVLEQNPNVDQQILKDILYQLDLLNDRMHAIEGQIAQSLRHNEFLNSIRQRSSVPGGSCDFDLPAYHHWLQKPVEQRHELIQNWYNEFGASVQSIRLVLQLLRDSAPPQRVVAESGFYQSSLDTSIPYQLIRVSLPVEAISYAEISAGKHRYTIRFMQQLSYEERPAQTNDNVEFLLACCAL
jgi:cell division protein ZapD